MVFMVVFDFLADRTTKFMSWDNHRLIVPKENIWNITVGLFY